MLTILLPGIAVLLRGKPFVGILLTLLQVTVIGWFFSVLIAQNMINGIDQKKAIKHMEREMKKTQGV